jgi:hypothetical protein
MAGQRTQLALGGLDVEISLAKMSGDPSAAKWETRLVDVETGHVVPSRPTQAPDEVLLADPATPEVEPDPLGAAPLPNLDHGHPIIPQNVEQAKARDAIATRGLAQPATRTERGVTRDDGTWADLTERLTEIDERCKLDAMQVVATIPASTIPRERVRGASYVVPADETATKALALIFHALVGGDDIGRRALAVRWTKRTNQALGIIVPSAGHGALVLLEVEFAENMRDAPARAIVAAATIELSDGERKAASKYVEAVAAATSALDDVGDERRQLHGELLGAARAGEVHTLPDEVPAVADTELAALLAS